jgi:hypothetical protein
MGDGGDYAPSAITLNSSASFPMQYSIMAAKQWSVQQGEVKEIYDVEVTVEVRLPYLEFSSSKIAGRTQGREPCCVHP